MRWESVVFKKHDVDLFEAAKAAQELIGFCVNPIKVMIHFFSAREGDFVSAEMTAFSRRALQISHDHVKRLAEQTSGEIESLLENAEILLAEKLSAVFEAQTLFLYNSDTYSASGFTAFSSGTPITSEFLVQPTGTDETASTVDIFARGWSSLGWPNPVSLEGVFDRFYSEDGEVETFVLMEKRELLEDPYRLSD